MAEEYDYLFKSIVVGDGGVGKTALTLRFSKGFFTEDYKMTIGVDFHVKTITIDTAEGPIRCKLQLWDTGGQERFSSIRPMYYRGSLGVVLVFDLTNSDSFEHLPQWIEEVRANVKAEIPLLLVGNKSDLIDQRAVSMDEINHFTHDFNLFYMETSAKTGDGVGDCFYILACLMVGQGVPEQLIANSTVFAPGQIFIEQQEESVSNYEIRDSRAEYEAPPVPEPHTVHIPDSAFQTKSSIDLEYEAPPVPEPRTTIRPQKLTSFTSNEDIDFEAPPVPEPPEEKKKEAISPIESAPESKIELPEPTDIEFKMPDEILLDKSEQFISKPKTPTFFEPKTVEGTKYVPKAIPFSTNIPTPVSGPREFQGAQAKNVSSKRAPQSAPSQEIEPESESLVDYMPEVIISKKEKKKIAKEQKKIEKQKAKIEKEKQKQDKIIEEKKKYKKDKTEKVEIGSEMIFPTSTHAIPTSNSLFQALTSRAEDEKELPKKFTSFIASEDVKEKSSTKLTIIPNIADIEKGSLGSKPLISSQGPAKEDVKPSSKDLLICEQCGAILSADYAFCNKCGHKL
jgi:small GTP-binding protein